MTKAGDRTWRDSFRTKLSWVDILNVWPGWQSTTWSHQCAGVRPWPFGVTWRHRSRDHSTHSMWFPIGAPCNRKPGPAIAATQHACWRWLFQTRKFWWFACEQYVL